MAYKSVKISSDKLRRLIEDNDRNVAMTARAIGVEPQTFCSWLSRSEPGISPENFERLQAVLKVSAADLKPTPNGQSAKGEGVLGTVYMNAGLPEGISRDAETLTIPEWPIDLTASDWAEVTCAQLDNDDPVQAAVISTGRFRLRIMGRCMEPDYPDGMLIEFLILRAFEPYEVGRDYAVCRSDGTATFKRLVKFDEDSLTLKATNQKDYPGKIVVPRQEVCRVAIVLHRLHGPPPLKKTKQ